MLLSGTVKLLSFSRHDKITENMNSREDRQAYVEATKAGDA